MHHLVFVFFFLSGFTSLVFEVLWERALMQVFGTTSLALSTLLTAFMTGLALGSHIGGRIAPRLKKGHLWIYGLLEGAIGLYALLIPLMLAALPGLYGLIFDQFLENFWLFNGLRFIAVFAILVVPTTMMGATLPIISQWISRRGRLFQGRIGLLYATNTLGACTGCLLAGFVLLPKLGLSATNGWFAASNVALCVVVLGYAWWMGRRAELVAAEVDEEDEAPELAAATGLAEAAAPLPPWALRLTLVGFALAGLVSMSYQVLWTRAYVIVLGSSTYSFTLILTTFLFGLAGGSAVMSGLVSRIRRPLFWLATTQFGLAALATVTFWVIDDLPEWLFHRLREEIGAPEEIYVFQFFLVGALVFVPVALAGMAFPLVVRAVVRQREHTGSQVARAYTSNTIGAIVGSFAAGFVLMPALGLHMGISTVIGINLVLASLFGLAELGSRPDRRRAGAALAAAATLAAGVLVVSPSIDRVRLTRGMFRVYWARELFDPDKLAADSPELLFYEDGMVATTTVEKRGGLVTLKANGKPEASDGADMATQILVALTPFLVRSANGEEVGGEEVAMVGYGSGVTAGAALQWPLERLDVIEIEPAMVGASRFFDHVNHRPLEDERTVLWESDGRNFLEYVDRDYDVIVSEPSNPWIAGVASLFTVEHFERARKKLKDGGTFAQWVQLYEISPENVRTIFATFLEVFPHVQAFSSMPKGTDLILVGSDAPITYPAEGFARAWADPTVRAELQRAGIERPHDLYGLMFMNQAEMEEFAKGGELNTDDNGLLEFAAPRDLIRYDIGESYFQERYFRSGDYGDIRPHLEGWPQGWSDEQTARLATAAWVAGKEALAAELLSQRGLRAFDDQPAPPFDELDQIRLVLHAQSLSLDEAMVRAWPAPGSRWHRLVADTVAGEKHMQAMVYLESEGQPPREGFDGEKGLAYAYVLAERHYYRHALEQLEGLAKDGDPVIVDSLPYRLLNGWVSWKRRHYADAWQAYLEAGAALAL